jgi:16S rRNA (adenine1518-N6/adenine1519-N6)-dimethyltransferase
MKTLLGAAEIRELAKELDLKPTKKLGQNFVVDANTCRKIVKLAEVVEGDIPLEIGPGLGSLTLALLENSHQVLAVEIDNRLANQLAIIVLNQDAMGLMQLPAKPTVLVANLPYNISVPVLLNLLERFPSINRGVVMVQSEVAYRLAAKPGNKQYGSPTAKANWWVDLEMAGSVGRSVFWPIPNVDSSLVRFTRHAPLGDERQRTATFSIIDQAFAKRRKMMRSAIADLFAGEAENNLIAAGIDPTIRGEALSVEQFFQIGEQLLAQNSRK